MVAGSKLRQRGLVCEIYFIASIENGFDWKCRVVWKQTASCLSAVLRKPKFFLPLFKFTFFVFLSLFKSLRTTCLAWTIMTFVELLLKTVPQAFVHLCFALCLNMQLLLFEEKIAVFVVCSYSVVPACDFNTVASYR